VPVRVLFQARKAPPTSASFIASAHEITKIQSPCWDFNPQRLGANVEVKDLNHSAPKTVTPCHAVEQNPVFVRRLRQQLSAIRCL
jgi:hypothetical protein